jgi:hypothetical protein
MRPRALIGLAAACVSPPLLVWCGAAQPSPRAPTPHLFSRYAAASDSAAAAAAADRCFSNAGPGALVITALVPPTVCHELREESGGARAARVITAGREHVDLLAGGKAATAATASILRAVDPLVKAYFARRRALGSGGGAGGAGAEDASGGSLSSSAEGEWDDYYLSEMQVVVALPGQDENQPWHVDNPNGGITLVVPLAEEGFTAHNGPTELLLLDPPLDSWLPAAASRAGARAADDDAWLRRIACWLLNTRCSAFLGEFLGLFTATPAIKAAPLPQGAALLFDACTLHRGTANSSAAPRPALILRWDWCDSPAFGRQPRAKRRSRAAVRPAATAPA